MDKRDDLELLTVAEVARRLKLSRAKTYELIFSGRLKSVKLDRCRRVAIQALADFVDGLSQSR